MWKVPQEQAANFLSANRLGEGEEMMYRLSILVVPLMLVNSATALAQAPGCIFTMQPFTFTADCFGTPPINSDVDVDEVVRGVIEVDMGEFECLQMEVEVKKAQGWVLNFGNSPTNNGFGGDAATFQHDSEFEIFVPGPTPTPGPPGAHCRFQDSKRRVP